MTFFVDPIGDVWGAVDKNFGHFGSTLPEVIHDLFLTDEHPKGFDRQVS